MDENTLNIVASNLTIAYFSIKPEPLVHFLDIGCISLPYSFKPIIDAFWLSTKILNNNIYIRKYAFVIFGTPPFKIYLNNGILKFEPNNSAINTRFEETIFYNCEKMFKYSFEQNVACILEELVHVFMNVSDEILSSQIVALLYKDVSFVDGKFLVNDHHQMPS